MSVTLAAPAAAPARRAELAWSATGAGTAAIAEYRVQWKTSDSASFVSTATGLAPATATHLLALPAAATLNWHQARVRVQACDAAGTCVDSNEQPLLAVMLASAAYIKASNTGVNDQFGGAVALSADGSTLAVGAPGESSASTAIDGNQADDSAPNSGAVYVFVRDAGTWRQQAWLKPVNTARDNLFGSHLALSADGATLAVGAWGENNTALGVLGNDNGAVHVFVRDGTGRWSQEARVLAENPGIEDRFGISVALSADGNTLAIGAYLEDSNAAGINGDQTSNATSNSGAAYVYTRSGSTWSRKAYVKASNPGPNDNFGFSVALAADGATLAVGAPGESSGATGIDGNQADNSATSAGAVYVFTKTTGDVWSQEAFVKASNTAIADNFGRNVALSADGNTLAVTAPNEDSSATGIDGNQADDSAGDSGAVYVFVRTGATWRQQAYVKASTVGVLDRFGGAVALSATGDVLLATAFGEDSNAVGIGGPQADDSAAASGAAYVFVRAAGAGGTPAWTQQAYVKATNTGGGDVLGLAAALSGDGATIVLGALLEASNATGVGGNQSDNSVPGAGAVYVY